MLINRLPCLLIRFLVEGLSATSVFMDEFVFFEIPTDENRRNLSTGLKSQPYTGLPSFSKLVPTQLLRGRRTPSLLGRSER